MLDNQISIETSERFIEYINNWDYEKYLVIGGYGSSKSWNTALKIILACLESKRKVLVCRKYYETIRESCFDLFKDILGQMNLLSEDEEKTKKASRNKVIAVSSPMQIRFPNGSRIIFKGMDNVSKIKSIHGVSIIWIEECSEVKFEVYEELTLRIRNFTNSLHILLTCNPVGRENWVYNNFFVRLDNEGKSKVILDEEILYKEKTVIKNGVYYHHSVPDDNCFLPKDYIQKLEEIAEYDFPLYKVARMGRFGPSGTRVLPQFEIATNAKEFKEAVKSIPQKFHYYGFDFGFEESFNAVLSLAVDDKNKILYIYDEIYVNHITDDKMANREDMQKLKNKINRRLEMNEDKVNPIVADNEDPKAIQYYRQQGFFIRACRNKFAGSRLSNTRKIKRFRKIICSPKCINTIRELKDLTYKKDNQGNYIFDEFNIDPHTFNLIA